MNNPKNAIIKVLKHSMTNSGIRYEKNPYVRIDVFFPVFRIKIMVFYFQYGPFSATEPKKELKRKKINV